MAVRRTAKQGKEVAEKKPVRKERPQKPVKKEEPRKKRVNRESEQAVKRAKSLWWLVGIAVAILTIGSLHDVFKGQNIGDASANGVKKEVKMSDGDASEKYRLLDRLTESLKAKSPAGNIGNGVVVDYRSEFGKKDKDGDLVKVMIFIEKDGWLELEEAEQKKLVQTAGAGAKEMAEYIKIQKAGVSYISLTIVDNKSGEHLADTQAGKLAKM
ncbi:hypothetical protein [Bacillus thuringiensis]|uniref:hypothetical protein n=1 Tax=Bacillus thuringiensis TaxID=1428 RepID=UPI000BFD172C|nr:hypothetical protein [Bacillus thuringiensis]PGT90139.1 hypothetical protein COD17_10350 [Bacillus thuringiensis]